jgi:hypothetical protein
VWGLTGPRWPPCSRWSARWPAPSTRSSVCGPGGGSRPPRSAPPTTSCTPPASRPSRCGPASAPPAPPRPYAICAPWSAPPAWRSWTRAWSSRSTGVAGTTPTSTSPPPRRPSPTAGRPCCAPASSAATWSTARCAVRSSPRCTGPAAGPRPRSWRSPTTSPPRASYRRLWKRPAGPPHNWPSPSWTRPASGWPAPRYGPCAPRSARTSSTTRSPRSPASCAPTRSGPAS